MAYDREAAEQAAAQTSARLNAIADALLPMLPEEARPYGFRIVERATSDRDTPGRVQIESRVGDLRLTIGDDLQWTKRNKRGSAWACMPRALPIPETPEARHWQMLKHLHTTQMRDSRGPDAEAGFDLSRDPAGIAREIIRRVVEPALAWAPAYRRTMEEQRGRARELRALARSLWFTVYDGAPPNDRHLAVCEQHDGWSHTIRPHAPYPAQRMIEEIVLNGNLTVKARVPQHLALAFVEALMAFEREHFTTTTTENQA